MSGIDEEFKIEIAKHMGCVSSELKTLTSKVNEFKTEQKASIAHNDSVVKKLQKHVDGRIENCHKDVMNVLDKEHMNAISVRDAITKAIKASEKRGRKHFSWFLFAVGSLFGFIYTYFEPISNFISNLKGN